MPADTRELLSLVSVCDPIPAELAGELSGRQDAARELNALHHDSGLITRGPLPSEYRVHVLLRSYLRAELARQRPTLILQLNARAARWWAARDQPVEALRQAMNGVPPAVLTDLLRRFVLPLLLTGEHATLRRALSILGEAAFEDPLLAATQAALSTASIDGAGAVELQALRTVTAASRKATRVCLRTTVRGKWRGPRWTPSSAAPTCCADRAKSGPACSCWRLPSIWPVRTDSTTWQCNVKL
jgi:LuxR family maltose regulon positive regulatory protein